MDRRKFLLYTGVTFPTALVGCLYGSNTPNLPNEMNVDINYMTGSHLRNSTLEVSGEQGRTFETVITDRKSALDRMKNTEQISNFIQQTGFMSSYIVVIDAAAWPSDMWLELEKVEYSDTGLQCVIAVVSPDESVGDDAAVHSLALRITDAERAPPEMVHTVVKG